LASLPGGHLSDRRTSAHSLVVGTAAFLVAYLLFAGAGASVGVLLVGFVLSGVGIGFVETAEAAAVAALAPEPVRGSAFGLLAGAQSLGNFAASAVAGLLWTLVSATAAFLWLALWMAVALVAFAMTRTRADQPERAT
jgi:MFS family permease